MTLSRSNTPSNERRELNESVQELDNLLEDLKNAQVTDERSYNRGLEQRSHFYSSSSSLNVPGNNVGRSYSSATSPAPLQKIANSSAITRREQDDELDTYTSRLERELGRDSEAIPRGVFVKDVVEEEILVDHVLVPKTQQHDKKFTTRPSERRQITGTSSDAQERRRQVAFKGSSRYNYPDTTDDGSETYDNTDTEDNAISRRNYKQDQSASMQSLNSATTEQSEAMTESSSILDPNKVVNCYVCGERVVGQVITALGRNYHKEHFTCAHCNQELGTKNFYERDNLPYCERDYQQLFSPKCAACGDPILDKVTIALEKTFHPEHFVCTHCGCQFDVDDGFHEKDGKPYCKNDFFDLFANKCAGCNLPITANYITALGVQWHPDCFVCSDCHCPFADGKFFDIDGAPYCEIHYHARRGSLCAVCRQPIIGKCITAMFRKFHPDHFTCTYCLKVLTKSFKEENDKPYCHDCFDKLYS